MTADGAGPVPPRVARLQARITAYTPLSLPRHATLARALVQPLYAAAPSQAAIALTYAVAAGQPGANRASVYLRLGVSYGADAQPDDLQERRIRRLARDAYAHAHGWLSAHFLVEPVTDDTITSTVSSGACAERQAEVILSAWGADASWMAPIQMQRLLDLMVRWPESGAVQFTVQYQATAQSEAMDSLVMGIVALGSATRREALGLLATELRGRGVLNARRPPKTPAPTVHALFPSDESDRARIARNLSGPAVEYGARPASLSEMRFTDEQAALLLPLPFALFA